MDSSILVCSYDELPGATSSTPVGVTSVKPLAAHGGAVSETEARRILEANMGKVYSVYPLTTNPFFAAKRPLFLAGLNSLKDRGLVDYVIIEAKALKAEGERSDEFPEHLYRLGKGDTIVEVSVTDKGKLQGIPYKS